jgi:1-acyl-sn-glycerol-3-phosphate acyltransferase
VRLGVADTTAMREAVRRLKQGWCLVVFPEGTRTQDGSIGRLKPGVLMIAERAGVPIVPAVVEGAFEAWPRSGGMRRHPISVWYGRPISAAQRSNMSRQEFAEALRAEMLKGQALLKKMRSRVR